MALVTGQGSRKGSIQSRSYPNELGVQLIEKLSDGADITPLGQVLQVATEARHSAGSQIGAAPFEAVSEGDDDRAMSGGGGSPQLVDPVPGVADERRHYAVQRPAPHVTLQIPQSGEDPSVQDIMISLPGIEVGPGSIRGDSPVGVSCPGLERRRSSVLVPFWKYTKAEDKEVPVHSHP